MFSRVLIFSETKKTRENKTNCFPQDHTLSVYYSLVGVLLILYTLTSVSIFSMLFSLHFLRCWQGEFVLQLKASWEITYMPTLPDYSGVSRIQSESPTLPYGWPKLPDKRKFGSVAHEKLKFQLHIFQNYKIIWLLMLVSRLLTSFCCVMRVVGGKQEEEGSPLFLLYKRDSDWMSFKSLTDWSTFFPRNYSGRGGGVGSPNQKKFSGRGLHWRIWSEGGGVLIRKKSPDLRSLEVCISEIISFILVTLVFDSGLIL